MEEEIPLDELPKGSDDDNDDGDGTFYQSPNTSTTFEQDYAGYDEYKDDEGRNRAGWDKPAEGRNLSDVLKERDEEYYRRREAGQQLKSYFPNYNPNDRIFNVTFGEDGSLIGKLSSRGDNVPHILVDKNGVIKLEDLPKTMRKALGADYESMLERYNNTKSQLNEEKEKNKELLNTLQGIESSHRSISKGD